MQKTKSKTSVKMAQQKQFCSPGFNLPIGLIMRKMFGKFNVQLLVDVSRNVDGIARNPINVSKSMFL